MGHLEQRHPITTPFLYTYNENFSYLAGLVINFGSSKQHREECDKDAVGTDATGEEVRGEEEVFECDGEKNELDEDAVPFAVIFFSGSLILSPTVLVCFC